MIRAKVGGIVFGGLAGYLILSKGIHMIERSVYNICVAKEWAHYYKYGKDGNMVPPGYSMRTKEGDESGKNVDASGRASNGVLSDAIAKAINNVFDMVKKQEGASEGQKTASNEVETCPHECMGCTMEKCPYESMRNGGQITAWDDDGNPVAGRYPWSEGSELNWSVEGTDVFQEEQDEESADSVQVEADDIEVKENE